jgi:hypothetical protein
LTFKRSTLAVYQSQIAALNTRSQNILKERAAAQAQQRAFEIQAQQRALEAQAQQRTFELQARFVSDIDAIIGKMERFDSEADLHLGRFPGAEKGYEAITEKIEGYVARERQLAGNPNAAVARGQLSAAANQVSSQTDQMHYQGESLQSSLETNVKPVADQATAFEQQCRAVSQNSGNLTPAEIQNVNAACDRLESAVTPFRQKFSAMSDGLAHLEQVYRDEHRKQEQLLQTAYSLQ